MILEKDYEICLDLELTLRELIQLKRKLQLTQWVEREVEDQTQEMVQDLVLTMVILEVMWLEESWEVDLEVSLAMLIPVQDHTLLETHLIREGQRLAKKLVSEQVQQELLQGLELIMQMEVLLIKEEQSLEMLQEMEGIQYQILQGQGSILLLITLVKKELNLIWEADINYLRPLILQDQVHTTEM